MRITKLLPAIVLAGALVGCDSARETPREPETPLERAACGRMIDIGLIQIDVNSSETQYRG